MEGMGYSLDVKPLIRTYVGCIGRIHEHVRKVLRKDIEQWESTLEEVIGRFKNEFGNDVPLAGLAAVRQSTDRKYAEKVPVFREFIEYRRHLESKNRSIGSLEVKYVSGHIVRRE